MRKKIFISSILLLVIFPLLASAQIEIKNPLEYDTFEELLGVIINFLFWVAVAISPLLILIGAFYFITAAGDPTRIETGKKIILWTCVGLFIILFAWGLIALVKTVLGVV